MSTDIGKSQRDAIKQISPPFLSGGNAEKYEYNIGLGSDALLEKLNEAMQAHMPGLGDPTTLPLLGADRLLVQGPLETNTAFAGRLTRAFDAWQHAGSSSAILQQVLGYVTNPVNVQPGQVPIGAFVSTAKDSSVASWDIVYNTASASAPPAHSRVAASNWNWDGGYKANQAFLILYFPIVLSATVGTTATLSSLSSGFATLTGLTGMTSGAVGQYLQITGAAQSANNDTFQIASFISATSVTVAGPTIVTSDANNGSIHWTLGNYPAVGPAPAFTTAGVTFDTNPNISIGLNVAPGFVTAIRNLVKTWKSDRAYVPWIIFCFAGGDGRAGTEFSPLSAIGSGNPDGTWGPWAKTVSGAAVASRVTGVSPGKFDDFADGTAVWGNSATPIGT
jgi:hypothetical protein